MCIFINRSRRGWLRSIMQNLRVKRLLLSYFIKILITPYNSNIITFCLKLNLFYDFHLRLNLIIFLFHWSNFGCIYIFWTMSLILSFLIWIFFIKYFLLMVSILSESVYIMLPLLPILNTAIFFIYSYYIGSSNLSICTIKYFNIFSDFSTLYMMQKS